MNDLDLAVKTLEIDITPSPDERPENKHCVFNKKKRLIIIKDSQGRKRYDIDLTRCKNSAQLLDWIFQIFGKSWKTPEMIYDLLDCLNKTCYQKFGKTVQGVYCSGGEDMQVNWEQKRKGSN